MYQPSLLGVYLIVLSFAYAQYDRHGLITPQMWCFVGFWFAYLFTHYVKEEFMLSTWDIIAENFGFMLVWGDLVYVPFWYSLPGFWIVDTIRPFTPAQWIGLCAFFLLALAVFRGANWQKDHYKRNPQARIWGKPAQTIGGRLLVSGWWGIGRKLNYTGEVCVYLTFALCAGVSHWQPFLVPLSLFLLLTQRAARDDRKCRAKYGRSGKCCRRRGSDDPLCLLMKHNSPSGAFCFPRSLLITGTSLLGHRNYRWWCRVLCFNRSRWYSCR
jgi:delta14-sterol reductase